MNDPPVPLADHHPASGLAGEIDALDVDVERQIEVGFVDVLGEIRGAEAGVVDEDVEPPELGCHTVDGRRDLVELADVHRDPQRAPAHRADLGLEVLGRGWIEEAESHVGPGVGEGERDCPAQAAGGSGDERGLARQVEAGKSHWLLRTRRSAVVLIVGA